MGASGALFVSGILMRLSPDSARTKNTMANIIPSQKIARTAFDLFMLVIPSSARQRSAFSFTPQIEPPLVLFGSMPGILRRTFKKMQGIVFAWRVEQPA